MLLVGARKSRSYYLVLLIVVLAILGLDTGEAGMAFKIALVVLLSTILVFSKLEIDTCTESIYGVSAGLTPIVFWVLIVSLAQSLFSPVSLSAWLGDATTYLLFAGFVAALNLSRLTRWEVDRVLVFGSIFASAAFAITWTSRRGIGYFVGTYVLGSKALLVIFVSLAFARALSRPGLFQGLWWVLVSAIPLVAIILTGTRSGLLLFGVLIGELIFAFKVQSLLKLGSVGVVVALGTMWASSHGFLLDDSAPEAFAQERLARLLGAATSGKFDDELAAGRFGVTDDALRAFVDHPLLGNGLGVISAVDSSVVTLAKFGLIGSAVLVLCLGYILRLSWIRASREEDRIAVAGVVFGLISLSVVAAVFEDMGLGLGLGILLLAIRANAPPSISGQRLKPSPQSPYHRNADVRPRGNKQAREAGRRGEGFRGM